MILEFLRNRDKKYKPSKELVYKQVLIPHVCSVREEILTAMLERISPHQSKNLYSRQKRLTVSACKVHCYY